MDEKHLFKIIVELILILSLNQLILATKLQNCAIDESSSSAICTSIPKCTSNVDIIKKLKKLQIDDITKIERYSFTNCTYKNINEFELKFTSLSEIESGSFMNMIVDINTNLNIIFDGSNSDNGKLNIKRNAFYNLILNIKSKLIVSIINYNLVLIEDKLINDIKQDEYASVNFKFENNNQILFTTKKSIIKSVASNTNFHDNGLFNDDNDESSIKLSKNQTFKIEIINAKYVFIEEYKFKNMIINPLSKFELVLININEVFLSNNLFDAMMMSLKSEFSFTMYKLIKLSIGENLFQNLIQEENSKFLFLIEDLSHDPNDVSNDSYEDYDETYYDDYNSIKSESDSSMTSDINTVNCFYLAENFLKNLKQNQNSIVQIHFVNINNYYINVGKNFLSNILMNKDSKIQIFFSDINNHIIFNQESINHVQMLNGVIEIWVQNHTGNQIDTYNAYLIFNKSAFKFIYLTAGSYFRIGFYNSSSIFHLQKSSFSQINRDNFEEKSADYRTKITLEIKNSRNFRLNLDSSDDDDDNEIPQIFEIDDYEPLLSFINSNDGSIDTTSIFNSLKKSYKTNLNQNNNHIKYPLIDENSPNFKFEYEFCQYSQINSYLKKNLLYFSKSTQTNDNLKNPSTMCSSCLYIYLYRFVHRRYDFQYIKERLPSCFVNLFYNSHKDIELLNQNSLELRFKIFNAIESKLNYYWKLQKCSLINGMISINDTYNENLIEKNICSKYFHYNEQLNNFIKHKNVTKICFGKIKLSSSNVSSKYIDIKFNRNSGNYTKIRPKKSLLSNILAVLFIFLTTISCLVIIIGVLYKRRYLKKPCIHLNIRKFNFKSSAYLNINKSRVDQDDENDIIETMDNDVSPVTTDANTSTFINKPIFSKYSLVRKFLNNRKNKINKPVSINLEKNKKYDSIASNSDRLGKYQSLNQTASNLDNNNEDTNRIMFVDNNSIKYSKKKLVNVTYDIKKNKTSLLKNVNNLIVDASKIDGDDEIIYDEAMRLKANPIFDIELRTKKNNLNESNA